MSLSGRRHGAHPHGGILLGHKQEQSTDTRSSERSSLDNVLLGERSPTQKATC